MFISMPTLVLALAVSGVAVAPAQASDDPQTQIVGGTTAQPGEFPWMVRLGAECGGALFTPSLVLTAAHCFETPEDEGPPLSGGTRVTVTQGVVDLEHPNRTVRTGTHVTIAPGYTEAVEGNDWALLKLDAPIFGVPLLKIASDGSFQNGTFTVMGWGRTSEDGGPQRFLRKVNVPFVSDAVCAGSGGLYTTLNTASSICAGDYANGGVDTCLGDSGGPIVKRNAANEWVQVGITSWGEGCGRARRPGVYTEVNTFAGAICAAANALGGCPTIALNVMPNFTCPIGAGFFIPLSASGGAQPYTWSISGLPGGPSFDTSTGQIFGFLNQAGTFHVTYTVSDGMNSPATNAFTVTVTLPVPDVRGRTLAVATQLLQAAGLAQGTVSTQTVWDSSDSGKIMAQFPLAGRQVTLGSSVNLTVGRWGGANR
jgi:hypothetical protein